MDASRTLSDSLLVAASRELKGKACSPMEHDFLST